MNDKIDPPCAPGRTPASHLLLIDDDRKLSRLLGQYLESQGLALSVAHDGAEGLARLRAEKIDLVILDVMLPGIDGFEVLRQLRAFCDAPVLMLTGRGGQRDLVSGLNSGADDYLPKTASAEELAARINALLRRAQLNRKHQGATQAPAEARIGSLHVQFAARQVELEGRVLSLTSVEFDLLAVLIRHRGKICSREQLMQEVRDRKFDLSDRSVDVHIANLRKKLGDDSRASRFIRTVRGAGYVFDQAQEETP